MLLRLLAQLQRTTRLSRSGSTGDSTPVSARSAREVEESPVVRFARLNRAHSGAPTGAHLDILYQSLCIGGEPLLGLVERCLIEAKTQSVPYKILHRPLAFFFLAKYFLYALELKGAAAECGVFRGASARLLCEAARTRDARYAGAGLHLVDSFEGLAEPTDEDRFGVSGVAAKGLDRGDFAASEDIVRSTLAAFPDITYHRGWIPSALHELSETQWSFVHLDVDHFQPTYGCLEYFYPRLMKQGVIICDDYGSALFPGARRAWDGFCDVHDVAYVVLDTGQSVMMKQ